MEENSNNIEQLKENIRQYIKQNGNKEITGQLLQEVLLGMVDALVGNDAVANPEGEAAEILEKIGIAGINYTAPQGPQGVSPTVQVTQTENGYHVVITDKDGPHAFDLTNGPANTLSIGTVTDGEQASASIIGDAPNQQLNLVLPKGEKGEKGDPGQNAVNPFKGWFTTANIPTTGQEGDYCNVSNTSVTPHTVTIYRWSAAQNAFVDTSEVPDTANAETFASAEELNQVAIDNSKLVNPVNTANPTQAVIAKAKDVMQLKIKLEGVTASEEKVNAVVGTNVTTSAYVSGETGLPVTPGSSASSYAYFELAIPQGTKSIRFATGTKTSSAKIGYSIGYYDENVYVPTRHFYFDVAETTPPTGIVEKVIEVLDGETTFMATVECVSTYASITLNDFYCYLQSGTNVGEELANKASYSEMNGLWRYKKNLLNNKDFEFGTYYTNTETLAPVSSGYGVLSNKLYLEEDVTYTVSKIAANKDYKFFIAVIYNNNNEVIDVKRIYNVDLKYEQSGYNSYGNCTFIAKKWNENQSYVRLQLQFGIELGVYNQAQLEVGDAVTDFAEYNSVKEFDIAKESDLDETADKVASNTESIESIKDVLEINRTIVNITNVPSKPAIIGTTTYNNNQIGSAKSIVIPIEHDKGNVINIMAKDDSGAFIAFLKEDPSNGGIDYSQNISVPVTFATAHAKKFSFSRSTKSSFLITDDMNYLYVQTTSAGNSNITPSLIEYITQKELNILAIGNSNDTTELAYIPPILQQLLPDYHINLYVAYVGFGTIKDHLYMYDNDIAYNGSDTTVGNGVTKNAFVYCWRYGRYYEIQLTGITLKELLELHKWHIVKFITQRSDEYALVRGVYEDDSHHNGTTKEQFITNCKKLLNILRSKLNCGFKFVTNIGGVAYTQESQYIDFLKEGCKILKNNVGVDFIIPDSLSTTIARSNSDLAAISGGQYSLLFSDNNHLNAGFPCLLTAYTAIECILRNLHINKSIYDSTLWIPTDDNARAIGAQASDEPNPSTRRMTYGVGLGIEENGDIIQSNILAAKEIAVIANNIMPELPDDDYILPPVIPEPASPEPASEEESESE